MADMDKNEQMISIHAPLARGDAICRTTNYNLSPFQSTPLSRGATIRPDGFKDRARFQSTPLSRGATRSPSCTRAERPISIHAPLARGDLTLLQVFSRETGFQSTPLSRGATIRRQRRPSLRRFQSTPLSRGATPISAPIARRTRFQSTPLSRGATAKIEDASRSPDISIHAPLARGDQNHDQSIHVAEHFNPRPSREGRHGKTFDWINLTPISIHAPLARGDVAIIPAVGDAVYFNPRPSREGRLLPHPRFGLSKRFQSTPLSRGATAEAAQAEDPDQISIHAPLARGDSKIEQNHCSFFVILHKNERSILLLYLCRYKEIFKTGPIRVRTVKQMLIDPASHLNQ